MYICSNYNLKIMEKQQKFDNLFVCRLKRLADMRTTLIFALTLTFLTGLSPHVDGWATACAANAADRSTTMTMGYTDGNQALCLGMGTTVSVGCAIQFTQDDLQRLKGARIRSLRLAMGETVSQSCYVFISKSLDAEPDYRQDVAQLDGGWNEITLTEPYELTGDELFVGFHYETAGDALSMDGRDDNDLANWLRIVQNGDEASATWQHQSGGNINLQVVLEGDNLPQNDVRLEKVVAKRYAGLDQPMPVDLIVRNCAAAEICSLDVAFTIEGQAQQTQTLDGLSIGSGEVALVAVPNVVFEQNGIANLDISIVGVNGVSDERPADNDGQVENVVSKKDYTNRKVLLEHFSTMRCNNCPAAHKTIEDALMYRRDVIHVVHHAGMMTDDLTISEHEDYLWFYSDGSTTTNPYAPAAMLDRTNLSPYGANSGSVGSTPGPVFFPQRATFGKLADQSLSTPALVSVGIDRSYDEATRTLCLTVSGEVPAGTPDRLKATDVRLNVFLTEDSIEGKQLGAPDPYHYWHNSSVRKVLTDTWGDAVSFNEGAFQSETYSFQVPDTWRPEQMHVVAFLANTDRTNSNNCKVFNANEVSVKETAATVIMTVAGDDAPLAVYVQNGRLMLLGDYAQADIVSVSGRLVQTIAAPQTCVPVDGFPAGVYLVRARTPQGMKAFKFLKK